MPTSHRFPYLDIRWRIRGFEQQVFAYIDTGFDGFLIIPTEFATQLGDADVVSTWELGDGSLIEALDYLGEIQVVDLSPTIRSQITCIGNEFLLGLGVLTHFKVILDHGQMVEIEE
ncbi:MAG: hypothetical protein HY347_04535 [candidate division NC10 bacterium]|nr:hypothetical protein [candidate division NC10 bacterium]